MRKKIILGTILTLSLLVVTIIATVATTLAASTPTSTLTNYGTGSMAYRNLPPPTNPWPPASPATPSRPNDIQLRPYDLNKFSNFGAHDAMLVSLWIPQLNSYNMVAFITDSTNIETYREIWNKTLAWYKTGNSDADILNVIQVADKDLEIWTEPPSSSQSRNGRWSWDEYGRYTWNTAGGDVFIAKLTKAVAIKLPFNLWPQPQQAYGNLTFSLPPLTLTFREIGADGYRDEASNFPLPSGWKYQPIAGMRTPAWVEERVPSWLGAVSPLEVVGHIDFQYSQTFTPPAT